MWGSQRKKSIYLNVCRNHCHLWFYMSPGNLECVPRGVKVLWKSSSKRSLWSNACSSFISVLSHSGDVGEHEPEVRQHEGKVRGHKQEGIEKLGSLFKHEENMEDVQRTWQPARQPKAAIMHTEPMCTYSLSPSIPWMWLRNYFLTRAFLEISFFQNTLS